MKATYNKNAKTKFTTFHRKESKCFFDGYKAFVVTGSGSIIELVDLRLYGTGRTNTAAIWIRSSINDIYTSGTGSAGGYGYHRPSAAAQDAISNAGFTLDKSIAGVGDSAITEAIQAICKALGYDMVHIIHSHQ